MKLWKWVREEIKEEKSESEDFDCSVSIDWKENEVWLASALEKLEYAGQLNFISANKTTRFDEKVNYAKEFAKVHSVN